MSRHRPQPRRHAAAGNRHRARHAQRRRGRGLRQGAARAGALDRHLRRQHAGRRRSAATPTSRCARSGQAARHAPRDQEPQLLPLPAAGDRVRSPLADRDAARTAAASSRQPCCSIPDTGETRMMRTKEDAHDYRYFPDPDLLPLVDRRGQDRTNPCRSCRNCPPAKRERFVERLRLSAYDAGVLTASRELADYFEDARSSALRSAPSSPRTGSRANCPRASTAPVEKSAQSPVSAGNSAGLIAARSRRHDFREDAPRRCSMPCGTARAKPTRSSRPEV